MTEKGKLIASLPWWILFIMNFVLIVLPGNNVWWMSSLACLWLAVIMRKEMWLRD